jgi:hypothetical protein
MDAALNALIELLYSSFNLWPLNNLSLILFGTAALWELVQLLRFGLRYPWRFATLLSVLCHLLTLAYYGLPDRSDTVLRTVILTGLALNFLILVRLTCHLLAFTLRSCQLKIK